MNPPQQTKFPVIRRLQADAQSIDPGFFPGRQLLHRDCPRIDFHSDFRVVPDPETFIKRGKNPGGVIPVQNRWSSPAHKNRAHTIFFILFFLSSYLRRQRPDIGLSGLFVRRGREEVAVCAFSRTERDMHIQLQISIPHYSLLHLLSHHPASAHS